MPVPDHDDTDTPTLSMRPDASFPDIRETPAPTRTPAPSPATSQPATPDPTLAPCPRCGNKLINPQSIGWCSSCGYCRSIEEGVFAVPSLATKPGHTQLGAVEFWHLRHYVPAWMRVLAYGTLVFCVLSAIAHFVLAGHPFAKAIWSLVQLILGLMAIFAAQVWALILIAPHEEKLGTRDLFIPGRLWGHVFRRLPDMHRQVWLGSWGAIAGLCAVSLIGGLEYWLQFYHPRKFANVELVTAANPPTGPNKDAEDDGTDRRPLAQCIIFGFIADADDHISSLLLAAKDPKGELVYVGEVKKGITDDVNRELLPKLRENIVEKSAVRGMIKQATWVAPRFSCAVHQDGYDEYRHLKSPSFANFLNVWDEK